MKNEKLICNNCGISIKKHKRECPVYSTPICSACCGNKRISSIKCTGDCIYNPFGFDNYDNVMKIYHSWSGKCIRRFGDYFSIDEIRRLLNMFNNNGISGTDEDIKAGASCELAGFYITYHLKNSDGLTMYEILEKKNFEGFTNDEKIMMRYLKNYRPICFEIQKIRDGIELDVVDLYNDNKLTIYDRSTANTYARFTSVVSWTCELPFYNKILGSGFTISEINEENKFIDRIKQESIEKYGKEEFYRYIFENYKQAEDIVYEMYAERMESLKKSLNVKYCIGVFSLKSEMNDILEIFDSQPDFRRTEPDDKYKKTYPYAYEIIGSFNPENVAGIIFSQQRMNERGELEDILTILKLSDKELRIEVVSEPKYNFVKKKLEAILKDRIELFSEDFQSMDKMKENNHDEEKLDWADKNKRWNLPANDFVDDDDDYEEDDDYDDEEEEDYGESDESGAEVDYDTKYQIIKAMYQKQYDSFLNKAIPALDGLTPRAAAENPDKRKKLIALMKMHILKIEEKNIKEGFDMNIDWVLKELGLEELL